MTLPRSPVEICEVDVRAGPIEAGHRFFAACAELYVLGALQIDFRQVEAR